MTDLRDSTQTSGLREVLALSWPASLSMLNATLMRFVDGLMVSWLGATTMNAQFVAGLTSFVPESFAVGMLSVVNTYVSQNYGAGRHEKCGQYAWAALAWAGIFCLLVAPLVFMAGPLFALFGHTPETQTLEVLYFRYMVISIFFTLTARPLEQFFYGIGRTRVVLVASVVANLFNIVGDWALIFGHWGLPRMGLEGAAIATMVSWALLLGILLAVYLSGPIRRQFATGRWRGFGWSQMRDIARIGWPAGVQFIGDVLPWTVFTAVIIGGFGPAHLAASTAAMRFMPLSFMPAVGISMAGTALVGRYIGAGRPDISRRRAHTALLIAMVYMGACAVLFWLLRYPMVKLFVTVLEPSAAADAEAAEIIRIGGQVMVCAAVFQLFDAVGIVFIGALRGAGETLWPMAVTLTLSLVVTLGGGYAIARGLPQLGSLGPWIAASAYVVILGILMARRFESGQWQKINLLNDRD